jgi:transcriptional regulator with XRE-family HTH domain
VTDAAALVHQLRNRREALGLAQREVAERMGTTQPALSDLENLRNAPRIATLERWAEVLGLRFWMGLDDPWDAS